jgi:biotin transport system substrate-specific component
MLAGAILGARRGGLALALFLVLVATGLPLLAGGRGGLGVFAGPSVGFLLAWPVAAYVIGWLSERAGTTYKLHWGIVANFVGGIVVVYVGGIVGMAAVLGLSLPAATVATWIYVPGDAVKVVIAALVARGVHAAYPGLLSRRRTEPAKETSTV